MEPDVDARPRRSFSARRRRRLARTIVIAVVAVMLGSGAVGITNALLGDTGDAPSAVAEVAPETADGLDPALIAWPKQGTAAVAVGGGEVHVAADQPVPMASITKLITALMVLEERPFAPGEPGDVYHFISRWNASYEEYLARGESALPVPAGGTLTQYQLLQGMLMGSACNYADILVTEIWGDDAAFAAAAGAFLVENGLDGIVVVEPTGIDPADTATAAALIGLGRLAMADPVIAEIVATPAVELPGAGLVENTNELLADPGVVGIKTGTLEKSNLLSAKDIVTAQGTVRVYVAALGQPDDEARFSVSRDLYRSVEAQLGATG
jgi:D-alanyl-D-alanine carboxypeptidase (penicillin-binding protein 5/6)